MVLEKTLESPLDSKEIQPVHPKGSQPEYSLEGLMLKLKLQHFGHLMQEIYMLVARLYPILFDSVDYSPSGSSVHGILHQEYWSGSTFPSLCRDDSLEKNLMLGKIEGRRRE